MSVAVLCIAAESGLVKLGNVSTDGTKIQGTASRHKAMSYGYMKKEVEQLREEIEALVTRPTNRMPKTTRPWAVAGVMSCPPSWRDEKTAWPLIEAAMQRLESQAQAEAEAERRVPQLRWNASARAKSVVAEPPKRWTRRLMIKRR